MDRNEFLVILGIGLLIGGIWLTDFLAGSWDWPVWKVGLLLIGILVGGLIALSIALGVVIIVVVSVWLIIVVIGVYLAASIVTVWYYLTEDMGFRKTQARIRNMRGD